jgi:hypothetical protein
MNTIASALLIFARNCVHGAGRAAHCGQHRLAGELKNTARRALDELNAIRPAGPVDPASEARRERARAIAATLLVGLH